MLTFLIFLFFIIFLINIDILYKSKNHLEIKEELEKITDQLKYLINSSLRIVKLLIQDFKFHIISKG